MGKAKSLFLKAAYKTETARYHIIHRNRARSVLRSVESAKGRTNPKFIRMADEYASEVLGWRGYSPWLYVYSAVSDSFKEGWIPDNYYGRIVAPVLQGAYGKMASLNSLSNKLLGSDLFPDLLCYTNGLWVSDKLGVLSEEDIGRLLFNNDEKVVYKLDNSLQGEGIFIFEKDSFCVKKIEKLGNGVFQSFIEQHPFFNELMPTSLATIRITTAVDNSGAISVRAAYLRIGRKAETHIRSSTHIRIPIDLEDGQLLEVGYRNNWHTVKQHPDTAVLFANRRIPSFQKCLSTAVHLHDSLPLTRCIGWDMIVDINNDVRLIEWNGYHNDIKFTEATTGPNFSDLGWENLWREQAWDKIKMDLNWRL